MNRTWVVSALVLASAIGCNRTRNNPPPPVPSVPTAASGNAGGLLGGLVGQLNAQIGSAATAMGTAVGSANAAMASAASAMPSGVDPAAMASAQAAAASAMASAGSAMPSAAMDPAQAAAMASAQAAAASAMASAAAPGGAAAPAGAGTPIAVGATVAGTLTATDTHLEDGSVGDDYTVMLVAGAPITVIARGGPSMDTPGTNLDTYLVMLQGTNMLQQDDDSAGNLNARILFTPPATGPYTIRVTTYGSGLKQGAYTLSVLPGLQAEAQ